MLKHRFLISAILLSSFIGNSLPTHAKPLKTLKGKKMAWFFNKPGVSMNTVMQDMKECVDVSRLAQGNAADANPEAANGLLSAAWTGMLGGGRTNLDIANCMSSRDYQRFEILTETQKSFTKRLRAMDDKQIAEYFTSEEPPEGKLANYTPNGLFYSQGNSLRATGSVPKLKPQQVLPSILKFGGPLILNRKLTAKPITTSSKLDSEKATLVARMNFDGKAGRFERPDLLFVKRDPKNGFFDLTAQKKPILFRIANHNAENLVDGFQIMQAEPGQYILWQVNGRKQSSVTYTCLSTIVIDIKAGENIYLGDWTVMSDGRFGVTNEGKSEANSALMTIDSSPSSLRSANYKNGADAPCTSVVGGGLQLYYFELPS